MRDSVTVEMAASPDEIWTLLSDVTRIGEFSPETLEAEWLGGATGPAVGAKFRGHVKRNGRGPMYWTECRVTQSVPGAAFEFAVVLKERTINTWGYEIAPAVGDGTTKVTEYFALTPTFATRAYWKIAGRWRKKTNQNGMRTTLERVRAVVEAPTPPGVS